MFGTDSEKFDIFHISKLSRTCQKTPGPIELDLEAKLAQTDNRYKINASSNISKEPSEGR